MALTRKFLKAMGIEDEKIDQIIEAHTESTDALKKERDEYKEDAGKLEGVQKELNTAKETLAKNGKGETVSKDEYDKLKKDYDDFKADISAKNTRAEKEHAFRELLKSAGVSEKRMNAIVKVSDIDGLELKKDGTIKDAEDLTESVKKEWADFIETTMTKGAHTATPPANNIGTRLLLADIYKKDDHGRYVLSTAERQKAIADNLNKAN